MSAYLFYQIINIVMMTSISFLIYILYNRLELKENRALFIATHGVSVDLFSWFAMSHMKSLETAMLFLAFSIFGRLLYGLGFIGYITKRYKAKFSLHISIIWAISLVGTAVHLLLTPTRPLYLTNIQIISIKGINLLCGDRGIVYFFHAAAVLMIGVWSFCLIVREMVSRRDKYRGAVVFNDVFFLTAVLIQGTVVIIYDLSYGSVVNFVPIFRACITTLYAYLSVRYHLINFDSLAHKTIMNDMGAGFMVLSEKLDVVYYNEIAGELFPELEAGKNFERIANELVDKREFQMERGGATYKITVDRIINNGHHEGYTALMVDISDIVQLENQAVINEIARKNLLTNISHELRTPLNAIIGASDMLENEEVRKDTIKEYLERIRVASINLDDILSDILSASAEYEGDKEAERVPYSICTLVDNVAEMCNERITGKHINFAVSVAEDIPVNAVGDDKRIRQILLTVLTNAIRYTDEGRVSLRVSGEYLSNGKFKYIYTIQDTGRSVFKDGVDINKAISNGNELGVDYTTGYGISLMVAKRLLNTLDGDLQVRSIKGKHNVCQISIVSELLDRATLGNNEFAKRIRVSFLGENNESYDELWKACHNLNIKTEVFGSIPLIKKLNAQTTKKSLLIFDFDKFGRRVANSEKAKEYVKVAVLSSGKVPKEYGKDFIFVRKPLSGLTLYKAYLENEQRRESQTAEDSAFTAPSAKALVVDDNSINLDIARGIIESFKITVDTVTSGYACLDLLNVGNHYDVIFMDYMMEGIDGIETTRRIREMETDMRRVPILAYTANSVEGAKENYINAGMDGVIYKPASMHAFSEALREFLPRNLLVFEEKEKEEVKVKEEFPDIEGIDFEAAGRYLGGNYEMYRDMLGTFAIDIDGNCDKFIAYAAEGNMKSLAVLAHGVKGLSRTLGILSLSEKMAEMEKAAVKTDVEYIKNNLSGLLKEYAKYKDILADFASEKVQKKQARKPVDSFEKTLLDIRDLLEDFEMEEAEALFNSLAETSYDEKLRPLMKHLKDSIEKIDYYASKDYVDELLKTYEE